MDPTCFDVIVTFREWANRARKCSHNSTFIAQVYGIYESDGTIFSLNNQFFLKVTKQLTVCKATVG